MKYKLPQIAKNSTLYSIALFLQKCIGFLLIPLYTRFLTPEDYGILNLLTSIMGFLSFFIMLSLHAAAQRFHYEKEEYMFRKQLWGTLLIMVLFNSLFLGSLIILFHNYIIDPFTENVSFWGLTIWSLISVMLSPLYTYYQQWLQVREEAANYTINLLINYLLTLILNILFVVVFRMGVFGMLLSAVIVSFVFFIYSFIMFIPHISLRVNKDIAKKSIRYSLPLVPNSVVGYASVMGDRILINKLANSIDLGLYSIAGNFGNILNTITTSINQAFSPWLYKELGRQSLDTKKLNDFTIVSIVICSYLAYLISLFSPEIVKLMTTEAFYDSWRPIIFLVFGYVLNGFYYFFSKPLFFYKPSKVLYISLFQFVVNIALNILLIPYWGYMGAGISFICSELVCAVISLLLTKRYCSKVSFAWARMFLVFVLFLTLSSIIYPLEHISFYIRLLIKLLLTIVVTIALYLFYFKTIKTYLINRKFDS